jgi:hypothetical protein
MNSEVQREIRRWDNEVDAEAAKLIRRGVPPYQAVEQAVKNISQRRAQEAEGTKGGGE